jgi:hypothetical protein
MSDIRAQNVVLFFISIHFPLLFNNYFLPIDLLLPLDYCGLCFSGFIYEFYFLLLFIDSFLSSDLLLPLECFCGFIYEFYFPRLFNNSFLSIDLPLPLEAIVILCFDGFIYEFPINGLEFLDIAYCTYITHVPMTNFILHPVAKAAKAI